ncbi:helix-turn-helix transcriptional regulator [Lysinibacillus sp. FSL K6-1151]|uniref:helix-turn-helix transcriptional regulator n=1 Tax=Lysinibacillus sp. FSL K6-1151 TaxID=2921465 RepID=UPI003159BCB9
MFFFFFFDEEYKNFGSFLKTMRSKIDLTQAQLAEKLGVSQQTINSWENNKKFPSVKLIPDYAKILGVDEDVFFKIRNDAVIAKDSPDDVSTHHYPEEKRDYQPDFVFHKDGKPVIVEVKNSLSSIDGAPLTEEELEKAKEYIRALRIMKNQNTDNK